MMPAYQCSGPEGCGAYFFTQGGLDQHPCVGPQARTVSKNRGKHRRR